MNWKDLPLTTVCDRCLVYLEEHRIKRSMPFPGCPDGEGFFRPRYRERRVVTSFPRFGGGATLTASLFELKETNRARRSAGKRG